jgi:hypothetical protein
MEAAWIAKASWTLENYLPPKTYTRMSRDLALDKSLTDVLGTSSSATIFPNLTEHS